MFPSPCLARSSASEIASAEILPAGTIGAVEIIVRRLAIPSWSNLVGSLQHGSFAARFAFHIPIRRHLRFDDALGSDPPAERPPLFADGLAKQKQTLHY